MNTFNIQRFLQTVKWTELTLLNHHIRLTVGVTLGLLGVTVGVGPIFSDNLGSYITESMELPGGLALLMTCGIFISYGALVVADMKRKQDCIFQLTLPASNVEKFWARVFHSTVGVLVCCLVAIVCADALHALLCLALRTPTASLTASVFAHIPTTFQLGEDFMDVAGMLLLVIFFLWMQSVYLLGGMFFRKRQWWLVTVIGVVVTGLVITAISLGSVSLAESGAFDGYVLDLYASTYIIGAVLVAFIVINYWLSYKIFSRIQLINNKWINV